MTPEEWIRGHVEPSGPIELASEEPWSTVLRVPVADGFVWFKHCKTVWSFEPGLAAALARRWPDRVTEVVAHDDDRAWLLTRDAGVQIRDDDPMWLDVMRRYVELQRGEVVHAGEHLAAGVPDLRLATLPEHYRRLVERTGDERLRAFAPRFAELCAELASHDIPDTIQHDDLHQFNVYVRDGTPRIHDWGDSCVSQPYFSLVATLRHVADVGISHAFLGAWDGDEQTLALALRVGRIAHALKGLRQLDAIGPGDDDWPRVLELAVAQTIE